MMKKISMTLFFIILLITLVPYNCQAGEFSFGLGYPFVSMKYTIYKSIDFEAKWATGEGINVYAGRFYWNFHSSDKLKLFTGLEGGGIKFDTLDVKGSGFEGGLFIGGEYFIFKKLSIAIDFNPTFISLKNDDTKYSAEVDGVDLIANIAIYFYLTRNSD